MPSVCTVSATMVGDELTHGLTRVSWQVVGDGVPAPADVDNAISNMLEFWTTIANRVVTGVVITANPTAIVQDMVDGTTTDEVAGTGTPAPVVGSDTSPEHVSGTGARIDWRTGVRRRSREMRGATFVVPMGSGQFGSGGNLTAAAVTAVQDAANALTAGLSTAGLIHIVYGRPLKALGTHPALGGLAAAVLTAQVPATPAFLKRRRA